MGRCFPKASPKAPGAVLALKVPPEIKWLPDPKQGVRRSFPVTIMTWSKDFPPLRPPSQPLRSWSTPWPGPGHQPHSLSCLQESWRGRVWAGQGGWRVFMGRELGLGATALAGTAVGWIQSRTGMGWWVREHGSRERNQSSTGGGHPNPGETSSSGAGLAWAPARPGHGNVFPRLNGSSLLHTPTSCSPRNPFLAQSCHSSLGHAFL